MAFMLTWIATQQVVPSVDLSLGSVYSQIAHPGEHRGAYKVSFAIQIAALSLYTGSCGECAHDVWKSCSDVESEFLPGKWFFEHTENGTFEITKGADDVLLYKGSTDTWSRDHPDEGHGNLEGELKKS